MPTPPSGVGGAQCDTSPAGGLRLGHHQPQGPWTGAGDATAFQMRAMADLADQFGFSSYGSATNRTLLFLMSRWRFARSVRSLKQQGLLPQHRLDF